MNTVVFITVKGKNLTGVKTYVDEYLYFLSQNNKSDIDLILITIDTDSQKEFEILRLEAYISINIPIPLLFNQARINNELEKLYYQVIVNILDDLLPNKKNLIFHLNWINHSMIAEQLKSVFKSKVVLTRHCIPWMAQLLINYDLFYNLTKNKHTNPVDLNKFIFDEKKYYQHIDHFITVTKTSKNDLIYRYEIDKRKITVINNGIRFKTNKFHSYNKNMLSLRDKYNLYKKEKILLLILRKEKMIGLNWTLKVIKNILNKKNIHIRLIIVGDIPVKDVLENNKELLPKITFMGNVNRNVLFDLYKISNIGIIPSAYEQCSYTAIEMMQHRLLIIASKVGGLKEILTDNINGLTFDVNIQERNIQPDLNVLEKKILFALNPSNYNAIEKMRENAFGCSLKKFNGNSNFRKTIKLYDKI